MPSVSASAAPERDEEWEAWLAYEATLDSRQDPPDPDPEPGLSTDPLDLPPIGTPGARASGRRGPGASGRGQRAAGQPPRRVLAADGRGPGMPASASMTPGADLGSAAGFAAGHPLDTAPGCAALMGFAEDAAGHDDAYAGATDDELTGAICAWDRVQAAASARKHAAVAELIRRRPDEGCALKGPARMPETWEEFTETEVAAALADSARTAGEMLGLAWALEVKLPGTKAAFLAGELRESKVAVIAAAAAALDEAEARAAEQLVLGRAGRLTPGGLRSAIARAVMQVAPAKARKRREDAAKDTRVERWGEDSGNAALAGRELPPAEVLAADQRITWWARELRKAGLPGDMDELRARAYLDFLLGKDSRPRVTPTPATDGQDGTGGTGGTGPDGPGSSAPAGPGTAPGAGMVPAGPAGRLHLTVTVPTLLDLADRPGEIPGIGPVDPWLARDLARAAASNPKTTWCVTVTDEHGHAIGHGCARPEPKNRSTRTGKRAKPPPADGRDPPDAPDPAPDSPASLGPPVPRFTLTPAGRDGPPGGYGTWRFSTGIPGQRDLIIAIGPIATDTCDHRFEAAGHNPGVKLRHLTQIRHATCTGPTCRRPSTHCDFEHNTPYEQGGRTCLCNGSPKCRHEHRMKQDPRWKVEQPTPGTIRWTAPSGRQYTTEPTRYPT